MGHGTDQHSGGPVIDSGGGADAVDLSRHRILGEIGDPFDLTVVRGVGNRGDDLILAGVRDLLSDRIYREIGLAQLAAASGHTVILSGGGAFCRTFHDVMPRALSVAELRFERVIVLPSSFDPSEDVVREVLARTTATVFAREAESYRRIAPLCDARLAHDCAFFFDFTPWRRDGNGTLNSFRTDHEARPDRELPAENDDISLTAPTLERWLELIAAHELVRTDRAHVMIAAARLGKQVEFTPTRYHKLDAIADFALADYPVRRIAPSPSPSPAVGGQPRKHPASAAGIAAAQTHRVSAVILSRDRPEAALRAIDSVRASSASGEIIVIDSNSEPVAAALLAASCARRTGVSLSRSERNLGALGGRKFALRDARGQFVVFLDDDAELEPGAIEILLTELEEHPEVAGVSATVVRHDGAVEHSGGWVQRTGGTVEFPLIGAGEADPHRLPPSGPCGWVPGNAALIRRASLDEFPLDEQMNARSGHAEWCFRVAAATTCGFRRSREARAIHHVTHRDRPELDFLARSIAIDVLSSDARFYERHRELLGPGLFDLVPSLSDAAGGRDLAAARLLMELLLANGEDWTFMEWMNGGLDGLLGHGRELAAQHEAAALRDRQLARQASIIAEQQSLIEVLHQRHLTLEQVVNGGWWRLRGRLLPLARVLAPLRRLGDR